ncbi:ABC transporter permease, partial [Fulvivirga sp. RKSG066]|uniref:ABC transporter permease n=1 Tax=Fulvivirga aurantia TaxID=2529383 RepID=UPI0012BB69FC
IIQREFISRVKKKSFLIATLLVPILFPAVIGGMGYLMVMQKESEGARVVQVVNESENLELENTDGFTFVQTSDNLEQAVEAYKQSEDYALLYIPKFDIESPQGFVLYTQNTPGPSVVGDIENSIERKIKDLKLVKYQIDSETLSKLNTSVSLDTRISSLDSEEEKESNSGIASAIGYATGFLIYIFLFVYGGQVMQGVIEEKNSKIVEVIVSTVKPFQFMLGKVIGVASVGLTQILIWVLIMGGIYTVAGSLLLDNSSSTALKEVQAAQVNNDSNAEDISAELQGNPKIAKAFKEISNIPFARIISTFIFYFVGGYLLYGALFAAVGSAVDTPADAQQFMLPIMLPIIIGFFGMSMFVFDDPSGPVSFWLSVIPFTSPIVMMGRIGFGVPFWELALSMVMLIGGFIFTIWLAGRIYRVGILMHGAKVNYKVLAKWFMMKN